MCRAEKLHCYTPSMENFGHNGQADRVSGIARKLHRDRHCSTDFRQNEEAAGRCFQLLIPSLEVDLGRSHPHRRKVARVAWWSIC
jgi:hypothetical protein